MKSTGRGVSEQKEKYIKKGKNVIHALSCNTKCLKSANMNTYILYIYIFLTLACCEPIVECPCRGTEKLTSIFRL